jgi:hypothetical protein
MKRRLGYSGYRAALSSNSLHARQNFMYKIPKCIPDLDPRRRGMYYYRLSYVLCKLGLSPLTKYPPAQVAPVYTKR